MCYNNTAENGKASEAYRFNCECLEDLETPETQRDIR